MRLAVKISRAPERQYRNLRRIVLGTRLVPELQRFRQHFPGVARFSFTMTKNIALSRPAMSAIAAFLALSTHAAFAQEIPTVTMTPPVAAPTPQTPPTVPMPSTTAPTAPPQATQPTAPKPVIRVPLDIAPVETTAPKATEPTTTPAPARAERTAQRAKPAVATSASASAAAPAAAITETAPAEEITPVAAPVMTPIEPVAEAAPPPAEKASPAGDEFPWEIVGGAAALLIVGGAGVAFARRRRGEGESEFAEESWTPVATTEPVAVPRTPTAEPASADAQPWVSPAYTSRERTAPAFAAAPSGSMGRHEAMAMAGPTPDNPFTTLSKRLKRARFLDRQERTAYDETLAAQKDMTRKPVSAWEVSQRPAPAAQEQQEVRRSETGSGRPGLRPGFARN